MVDDPLFCLLHRAVIDDDVELTRELAADPLLRMVRNSDQLTPLELSRYLGRESCLEFLAPPPTRPIYVATAGQDRAVAINREQFRELFGVAYRDQLYFPSYLWLQKMQRRCPLSTKYSPFGIESRELAEQYRHQLEHGEIAQVSIRWIDEQMGYGIFAEKEIAKGDFVGEFTGEVREISRRYPDFNDYCFHYPTRFFSWSYCIIDASLNGNEMRFVNHSERPNLLLKCLYAHSLLHVVLIAAEKIDAGTQLSYHYGRDFWRNRQKEELAKEVVRVEGRPLVAE